MNTPMLPLKITSGQKALLRGLNSHEYPIVQRLSVANIRGKSEKAKNMMKKNGNRLYLPWITESMADGCNKSEINEKKKIGSKH